MKHKFLNPLAFAVLTGTTAKYPGKISQIKSLNDLGTWKKLSLVISLQLIDFLIPGLQNKYHNLPLTHTVPWLHGPRAGRHFHAPPCPCNAQETRREKLCQTRGTPFLPLVMVNADTSCRPWVLIHEPSTSWSVLSSVKELWAFAFKK